MTSGDINRIFREKGRTLGSVESFTGGVALLKTLPLLVELLISLKVRLLHMQQKKKLVS